MILGKQKSEHQKRAAKERPTSTYIPYSVLYDDNTIKLKNGGLLQTIRLDGWNAETADASEIRLRKIARNRLWRALCSSEFALHHNIIRRKRTVLPEGEFEPGFARELNEAWKRQLWRQVQMVNDTYLTLIRKQPEIAIKHAGGVLSLLSRMRNQDAIAAYDRRAKQSLDEKVQWMLRALERYRPKLLGVEDDDGALYSELMEAFGFLINCQEGRYILPQMRSLDTLLPRMRPFFSGQTIILKDGVSTRYATMISLKEYCPRTFSMMTDALLALPHEFILSQSFRFKDRHAALSWFSKTQKKMDSGGDLSATQADAISDALDDIQSGEGSGEHHLTVMPFAKTQEELRQAVAAIQAELLIVGITGVVETINAEPCFFGQLPGNWEYLPRAAPIKTENLASFISGHGSPHGKATGNHLGASVTVMQTTSGSPYHLNFHRHDRGNMLVFGRTGSGKTTAVNFLISESMKLGKRRHRHFDKDRGAEIFIRRMGGQYFVIREKVKTGYNFLQLPDTPQNRAFIENQLAIMLKPRDAAETNKITEVVQATYRMELSERQLIHIAPLFGVPKDDNLRVRCNLWCGNGAHAWAFDNPVNLLDLSAPVIGFDLTTILDSPTRSAIAHWMLFACVDQMDGAHPTSFVFEEGWRLLDDEKIASAIQDLEYTVRKKNGWMIFVTQSPESVSGSKIAPALQGMSEGKLFFPNRDAKQSVYCGEFGLSRKQLKWLRETDESAHQFLLQHGDETVICTLDMTGMDRFIRVLSGTEERVRLLDEIRLAVGDDPAAWGPIYDQRSAQL